MKRLRVFSDWIRENKDKLLISLTFMASLSLAFVGGVYSQLGVSGETSKVVIQIPEYTQVKIEEAVSPTANTLDTSVLPGTPVVKSENETEEGLKVNCPYVGSKNSDKYHLASCGVVKRIKLENKRCFESIAIAEAAGYVAGCLK